MRERSRRDWDDHMEKYQEYNLLNANEIRTIANNQALLVSSNRNPVLLDVVPYFANSRFDKAIRRGEYELPMQQDADRLHLVPLSY